MKFRLPPGKYVVAVSGGVDSMVLLDLLAQRPELGLVVAHFDHGIRADSAADRQLVQAVAERHGLPFVYAKGELGPGASEAAAREARYAFLRRVMRDQQAAAIVTAHHQDDMLETAIINMLRGTGRRGLSSLGDSRDIKRPLLQATKRTIRDYARRHHLEWHEDITNADDRYLRNYIRHHILNRFGEQGRAALLARVRTARSINGEIDGLLEADLAAKAVPANRLDRAWYARLPYAVAGEVMAAWLRLNGIHGFDHSLISHLVVAAKTKQPGKQIDVNTSYQLEFRKDKIDLVQRKTPTEGRPPRRSV